jgi:hypothetical protein
MKRRSAWEVHLRTGRWVVEKLEAVETKFNPNHDPKDGRFTFAGQGMQVREQRRASVDCDAIDGPACRRRP